MPLIAHLCDDLFVARQFRDRARFPNRVRQRFLQIDVFAQLDRHRGGMEMSVIRRRDRYGIDALAFLLQHDAEVFELFRQRKGLERPGRVGLIDITKRHDVFTFAIADIDRAFAAYTDGGNVQACVRAKNIARGDEWESDRAGYQCGALKELTARDS